VRHLTASTDLTAYLDWPGLAQVFRLERTWCEHGTIKHALHYGITSLRPAVGPPERLLALKRGHWAIEMGSSQWANSASCTRSVWSGGDVDPQ
jgi:hypothetical protein